jgi:hypothetical protein
MLRRVISCAGLALVGAAVALLPPSDLAPRAEARPEEAVKTPEAKLIAAEASVLFSLRMGDFTGDELMKVVFSDVGRYISDLAHVSLHDVELYTLAVVRGGTVRIVRTRKPYDRDKLTKEITEGRFGLPVPKPPVDDKEKPAKVEIKEKKVGGKTICYVGDWVGYNPGFCALDKTAYAFGEQRALENLFAGKGKADKELAAAVDLAGKHSMVLAVAGERLTALIKQERDDERRERKEFEKKQKKGDKDSKQPDDKKEDQPKKDKEADDDDDDDDLGRILEYFFLPYKPLYTAKLALVTGDVTKKGYVIEATITAKDKGGPDAEHALKSLLYVLRETAFKATKEESFDMQGLRPLSAPVAKAFREAKVQRKGDVVRTTVRMDRDDKLAKKVKESIEALEKKRQEQEKKQREEDKKLREQFDKDKKDR